MTTLSEDALPMSPQDEISISFQYEPPTGRHKVKGVLRCMHVGEKKPVHRDRIDLESNTERRRFVRTLATKLPDVQLEVIEAKFDDAVEKIMAAAAEEEEPDGPSEYDDEVNPEEFDPDAEEDRGGGGRRSVPNNNLPLVMLPGDGEPINPAAKMLGELLAKSGTHFCRGGLIVTVTPDEDDDAKAPKIVPMKHATLASEFEKHANLAVTKKDGILSATCNKATAELICSATVFVESLPAIRIVANCPVLIERDGAMVAVSGYDREAGILTYGPAPMDMELEEAVETLNLILKDFNFATPADKSRAAASLLTPGLIQGQVLRGRAPMDVTEANDSQSGKGFRNKLTAAVYRASVHTITQKKEKGGVGSLEEKLDAKLVRGATFISFDNVRGKMESESLESLLTEDVYSARVPYLANQDIDPRRITVMFTSNCAEMNVDTSNRSSVTRILKQSDNYPYATYPEGNILDHVRANQPRFLGAVFAIIRAWYDAGKPQTTTNFNSFTPWARTLDWIVQNLWGLAPLLDGHKETLARLTSPHLNWLRDVAKAVMKAGADGHQLATHHIVDVLEKEGVAIPGLPEDADLTADDIRKIVWQATGRRLGQCFNGGDESPILIDGRYSVTRVKSYDPLNRRDKSEYVFTVVSSTGVAPDAASVDGTTSGAETPSMEAWGTT